MKIHATLLLFLAFFAAKLLPAQNPAPVRLLCGQAVVTFSGDQSTVASIKEVRPNALAIPGSIWNTPAIPQPSNWNKTRMTEIFGIALDGSLNVFFSATSLYGNPTSGKGGHIYKSDGNDLNIVYDYIQTDNVASGNYVGTNMIPNTGHGIGNIAYDRWNDQLFATNLEDGKIYRIKPDGGNPNQGEVVSVFDPFNPDDNFNSMAPYGERLWGIGVMRQHDGVVRVYFAVQTSLSTNAIYSVDLDNTGAFSGTERFEIQVPANTTQWTETRVTDIEFSSAGNILFAERGDYHNASVYECYGTSQAWTAPKKFYIGNYSIDQNANGGVSYGYKQINPDQDLGQCDSLIWATGNALDYADANAYYGIQGTPASGNSNASVDITSIFVDYDGIYTTAVKGTFGDVDLCQELCHDTDFCRDLSVQAKPVDDGAGGCCWKIALLNNYAPNYFSGVELLSTNGDQISYIGGWPIQSYTTGSVVISPQNGAIPLGNADYVASFCLSGYTSSPQKVIVNWLGPDTLRTVLCTDTLLLNCDPPAAPPRCVYVVNDSISCDNGKVSYEFQIVNNGYFPVYAVHINNGYAGVNFTEQFFPLPFPVAVGDTSEVLQTYLYGPDVQAGDTLCFSMTAHNNYLQPTQCCTDSLNLFCMVIPDCNPCDGVDIGATSVPGSDDKCCWDLSLDNQYLGHYFIGLIITGENGVQLSYTGGWNIQNPVSATSVTLLYPGGYIPQGAVDSFATICLSGFSASSQQISIGMLGPDSSVVCSKTLDFQCDPDPQPTCAAAVKDSLWCDNHQVKYTFSVLNSPLNVFPIKSLTIIPQDTNIHLSQSYFVFGAPIPIGGASGPITIELSGSGVVANADFCFSLAAHDNVWDPENGQYYTRCCIDSVNIHCVKIPNCCDSTDDHHTPCDASGIALPNGFTPNGDGINELFVIDGLENCREYSFTVFNRWGNVVYQQDNYLNDWDGRSANGSPLPQGTYYVILELQDSGANITGFVDLRRQ